MKINCLGGGPGGLYFSILAKAHMPTADITVYERNSLQDTFGWGVVFSDETLFRLKDADEASYKAITDNFAYWDAIDVHVFRHGKRIGEKVRSGGHGFCGVSRKTLLRLLQERASSLGVTLRFESHIDDPASLRDCDLMVAADGVNSRTRTLYEDHFQPSFGIGNSRFIWLGTRQKFEAFTFSFRENEHGVFQIHAYQFEPDTSTFIVECDEQTWRAAKLDSASEAESIKYCETLFSDELAGNSLMPNRSSWIQFNTVKCKTWHHENVVLMGDAAHTAHFSVGSGTKMAMEDSIGLANALHAHPNSLDEMFAHYEGDRMEMVARTQKAAAQSLQWFEEAKRHIELPPEQLAFSLLSRTRRVTHDNLKLRDAGYVERTDAAFLQQTDAKAGTPPMFTPFKIGELTVPNRVMISPMCQYSATDGVPNDWHLVHIGSRAVGGAGLIMCEMTNVSAEGRITPGCTGLYSDEQEAAWTRITDFVHQQSEAKVGIQLGHAGRKGATEVMWKGRDLPLSEGAWPLLAPSPIPWAEGNAVPKAMTKGDMELVTGQFVSAAKRAKRAGFDLVEVHLAHGYLLSSFLTPLSNQRDDEYGGSLQNRARFPLEVVQAVRAVWKGALSVRISATDWVEGAFDVEDAVEVARMLKEAGVDIVDVSAGQTSTEGKPVYGRAFQTPFSERIRNEVGIPTIAVGNIYDADRVNTILVAGRADIVAMARAHLTNPYWTNHAAAAQGHDAHFTKWPIQYGAAQSITKKIYSSD